MKILIADDSKTNLAMTANVLERMGHQVVAVSSGPQAIHEFKTNRPDLVILDVVMDGMDGFECARQIREIDCDDWIPIIFLSGSVDDISIEKGINAGGDDYLTKPYSEITLAAKIKAMQRIADMRLKLYETTQTLYLMSSTDPLTGIYNRFQFDRSIKEILSAVDKYHHKAALLFIDLDSFKNINDSFGHHVGDLLLVEVAKRLKSCLRANDFIGRLGGDEFAIVLSEISEPKDAENLARKILGALSVDYNLEGHHIRNGASVGIACYPMHARNQEELILNADMAMYHAKASGRNNFQLFSEELNEKYKHQISLEHALKFALERNELKITYQPIFDLRTKIIQGVEVLITWDHPTFGHVSPNIFIPLAEETGLISHIGDWVLEKSLKQAAEWPLQDFENFRFAINVSSRQLNHNHFYDNLVEMLAQTKIPPKLIELELTETAIMSYNNIGFKEAINKLHELGVRISIDDFGTGYSSLIRLKHLPINTLKIEKAFVQDAISDKNGGIIVSCLIALGKNLNLNVIAEGIETQQQLDFLINNGCQHGQGFYLSKPISSEKISSVLASNLTKKSKAVT